MRRSRILVADSVPIFRSAVRTLLARESDFEVDEVANLGQLAEIAAVDCPDVALIDLDLPPEGGIAAVEYLARGCETDTIVWSFDPTRESVLAAVSAGASGYLHKEISPTGLVRALRGVVHGEAPLSRDLATLMIDALHGLEARDRARERLAALSVREREVLSLLARRARNREIAAYLSISEFTVKRHVQNILQKLALPSRQAAAEFYRVAFDGVPEPASATATG